MLKRCRHTPTDRPCTGPLPNQPTCRMDTFLEAVICFTEELGMQQAEAADRLLAQGTYLGPLHGIPYGLKDTAAVPGYPTTWGCVPFEHQVIEEESHVYTRCAETADDGGAGTAHSDCRAAHWQAENCLHLPRKGLEGWPFAQACAQPAGWSSACAHAVCPGSGLHFPAYSRVRMQQVVPRHGPYLESGCVLDILSWTASGLPLQAEGSWRRAHCQAVHRGDGLLRCVAWGLHQEPLEPAGGRLWVFRR